jgi:DNA-binding transcriptional LysR family regulator
MPVLDPKGRSALPEGASPTRPTTPQSAAIELRHLRYFLAVYEELHFGRAAERLHVAQPPVSQAIRKLEDALGVTLFERSSREVAPTASARALADGAQQVLTSFDFAVSEARRVGADAPLRVGCVTYLPTARLQGFLAELSARDVGLRTEVIHLLALDQIARLGAGQLDLAVIALIGEVDGIDYEPLFPAERICAFVPADHRLADHGTLTPDDAAGETLLTFPRETNPAFYDLYLGVLAETGYRFAALHESNPDPRDVLLAAAGGLGIACGPQWFADVGEEGRELVSLPLDPEVTFPSIVIAWRADPPRALRPRLWVVREAARSLYADSAA